jgi:CRISPR/Cas system-associated endonuclease/helicase Cas3
MTIMSRPYAVHIDVPAPAPAPIRKPPVNPPKKKTKKTEAQKDEKSNEWKVILLDFYNDKKGLSQNVYAKIKGLKETTFKRH